MSDASKSPVSRRALVAGAGVAGAAAAAAALVPVGQPAIVESTASANTPAADTDERQGYRLTAHIQRYYQTAKV